MARWSQLGAQAPAVILAITAGLLASVLIALSLPAYPAAAQATPPSPAGAADPYAGLPSWLPRPVIPADNPLTAEKVELGRRLFYDTRLSITGQLACATCHHQDRAFTDGLPLAVGATGEVHPRNSMTLTNVAYLPVLTWANPLLDHLERQALIPLFGETPIEHGMTGREQQIFELFRTDPEYARLFPSAFPDAADPYTLGSMTRALASFQRTLISYDSPYDRYRYGRDPNAISEAAKLGERLFFSEEFECHHCHGGLNLTDNIRHERLAFAETAFHNTALYNVDGAGAYPAPNTGLREITGKPEHMGRFRTPTLRNIALTAPYMHDGSIPTLDAVLDHYREGGRTISEGPHAGVGRLSPLKDIFMVGFSLSPQNRTALLAFLESLTDEGFLRDPRFSDPFAGQPRPTPP
ncbi:MAG: di-heme enzyme [Gemmataceae bacterium]|nr:di-heme enzyme [Gemmataceae bacterium]